MNSGINIIITYYIANKYTMQMLIMEFKDLRQWIV